jgi:hypothetical protein
MSEVLNMLRLDLSTSAARLSITEERRWVRMRVMRASGELEAGVVEVGCWAACSCPIRLMGERGELHSSLGTLSKPPVSEDPSRLVSGGERSAMAASEGASSSSPSEMSAWSALSSSSSCSCCCCCCQALCSI